jgi:biotin carboxyl carrier protein
MNYVARVRGVECIVTLERHGDGVRVLLDGVPIDAALEPAPGGGHVLRVGGMRRAVDVHLDEGISRVTLGAREYEVTVEDERERAAHAVRPAQATGPRILRSAMPGIVRELLVAEGDVVEARRALLVLEAMKMQNEVRADAAGTVDRIHVAPGVAVSRGDPLITLR